MYDSDYSGWASGAPLSNGALPAFANAHPVTPLRLEDEGDLDDLAAAVAASHTVRTANRKARALELCAAFIDALQPIAAAPPVLAGYMTGIQELQSFRQQVETGTVDVNNGMVGPSSNQAWH